MYVNRWAYVYIGMYGFSYLEAGKNVVELFQNKGWTVVITDDLADNVLSMIALAIGLASGLVGLVLGYMSPNMFVSLGYDEAHGPAFFVGLLVGFLFASVILSVVGSAINTVIVCKYMQTLETVCLKQMELTRILLYHYLFYKSRLCRRSGSFPSEPPSTRDCNEGSMDSGLAWDFHDVEFATSISCLVRILHGLY